nr:amidohydrolase family protein [Paracoccus zhejiangensis]
MVCAEAARVPDGQWVREIGNWSPYQFEERRIPTVQELNEAAPDTPTFVLFLYSMGFLNAAGVEAMGLTPETETAPGTRIEFADGGAILHAEPNPAILYKVIADLPQLSAVEAEDFLEWIAGNEVSLNADANIDHGYELEGAGELLAHSVGDWENFMAPAPDLAQRKDEGQNPEGDLHRIKTLLVEVGWPLRQHATYGDSIGLIMDVFERVNEEQGKLAPRWFIDHAETIHDAELERIKALGGGSAIQNRMAFGGEYFAERYGPKAAAHAPPLREMLDMDIPVGGTQHFAEDNKLSRMSPVVTYEAARQGQ